MSIILVASVGIRLAAFAWSVRLLVFLRDWRLAFFSAMLALMTLRQTLTLLKSPNPWPINLSSNLDELPGLAVSVLAFLALIFLERMLSAERGRSRKLEGEMDERRKAEDALRKSEELFRTMTVNVPGVVYQFKIDAEGEPSFPYVSPVVKDVLGIEEADIIKDPNTWFDVIHPDDRPGLDASIDKSHGTLGQWQWEGRMIRSSGAVGWFRGSATPKKLDDGSVLWNGLIFDITDRAKAEAKSRENESLIRALIEHSPVAISIKGLDGRYSFISPAYTRYLDISAADAVGKPAGEVLPPNIVGCLVAADQAVLESGLPLGEDESFTIEIGASILLVTKFPIHDHDGNIAGIGTVGIDISELKETEEHLRRSQKMEAIGQLTGGIAHDFNNLLAVIMGNTELLGDRLGIENKPVQSILRASTRGAELTQRLLAFSRQQPLKPQAISLGTLVSGMSDMLARTLGETIEIEIGVAPDLWNASADPGQVENALLNLALNARDAMPGGGKLTIECTNVRLDDAYVAENLEAKAGDYVVLAVSDEGSGMTAEVQAHAFEPFFTTKEVGQGSGLGLSMIYGFAKQSGGHATIYSEEGQGTTVKLYLPRAGKASKIEEALASEEVPRGRGEEILVIEDDPNVRDLAVRMLEGLGYRVIDVPDSAKAHKVLADGKPVDLILSDVVLPGGTSGPEFAEQACTTYPDLKVIFMSGYPAEAAKRNGFLGSDKVLLNKPFKMQQLAKALRDALR